MPGTGVLPDWPASPRRRGRPYSGDPA